MKATDKLPEYSYLVRWSAQDREFVASFLELPELSGLAPTIAGAVAEAKTALRAWLEIAQKEGFEVPEASMLAPCMILDAQFAGKEPLLTWDIPEEIAPAQNKAKAETTSASQRFELEERGA